MTILSETRQYDYDLMMIYSHIFTWQNNNIITLPFVILRMNSILLPSIQGFDVRENR